MRRKLIKQGGAGLTTYLPKKWIDANNLQSGEEIEVAIEDNSVIINTIHQSKKQEKKTITLTITKNSEQTIRTPIANAYRTGADKIILEGEFKEKEIYEVADKFLLGFEVFKDKEKRLILESISEPLHENYENIIEKQFYSIGEILNSINEKNPGEIEEQTYKIQKYDNFLKRCIIKEQTQITGSYFLWQLLSDLVQISRICFYINKDIKKYHIKLEKTDYEWIALCKELFEILKSTYLKKDLEKLKDFHDKATDKLYNTKQKDINKNPLIKSQLLTLLRTIYIINSPLTGLIQTTVLSEEK